MKCENCIACLPYFDGRKTQIRKLRLEDAMKRLTLEIDLSENEIFDEEVTKAVRAKARETVRNVCNEDIYKEARREVERLFNGELWGYKGKLNNIVKSAVYSAIEEAVKNLDLKGIIEQAVEDKMDLYMSRYKVTERCEEALNIKVQGVVEKKIKELLN